VRPLKLHPDIAYKGELPMTSSRYLLLLLVLLLASLIALAVTAQEPPDPTLTPPLFYRRN